MTNNTHNKVLQTYLSHAESLSPYTRHHFASRLYFWNQTEGAKELLDTCRSYYLGEEESDESILKKLKEISSDEATKNYGLKNAPDIRRKQFTRFPKLNKVLPALFHIQWVEASFNKKCSHLFKELFDLNEIDELYDNLIKSPRSIALLSTHAINFLYLYKYLIKNEEQDNQKLFLKIAETEYNTENNTETLLQIYLLTHCIIAETHFYQRGIPNQKLETYSNYCRLLESIIESNYENINLDNKFESLVCAKICKFKMDSIEVKIFNEADNSLSESGNYLIDKQNNAPQLNASSLSSSEHRNVLYLMACTDFKPLLS